MDQHCELLFRVWGFWFVVFVVVVGVDADPNYMWLRSRPRSFGFAGKLENSRVSKRECLFTKHEGGQLIMTRTRIRSKSPSV